MANTKVKTPIVYYGGKTAILPHLLEMVPVHEVYTETFFGGGALFWAKDPVKIETINDIRGDVVNFYRVLKSRYQKLKKLIDQTLMARDHHREANNILRASWRGEKVDSVKLAWAFWMAANFSFSRKLGSGLAYSNYTATSEPDVMINKKSDFTELLVQRIEHAYIENDDALKIIRKANIPTAFHYLDPPYPNADQGHYYGYTWNEYQNLLNVLAHELKGAFLLSSYNSELLEEYIKVHGWHKKEITHRIKAPRKSGPAKVEVLVSNYSTPCGTLKLF
jgi:DNA adenine methylase